MFMRFDMQFGGPVRELIQHPDAVIQAVTEWLSQFAQPQTEVDTSIDWEDGEVEETTPDRRPR